MVDEGIYTKNADIQAYAGVNANATSKATAATDVYVLNVEAKINSMTRYNWSDAYTAGLNVDVSEILTETGAAWCAMIVLNSDLNVVSLATSQTMLDVLRDIVTTNISILRDMKTQNFIIKA